MKWFWIMALGLVCSADVSRAQTGNLLADAARQELEDRIRRQQAELEDLKAVVNSLSESLGTLNKQVVAQNEAMKKFADAYKIALVDYARKEDLTGVTRGVKEVESNREADKQLFLKKFEELRKLILDNPPKVIQVTKGGGTASSMPREEARGVEHTVAPGETASAIVEAYNSELKRRGSKARVTFDLLKQANPGLNLDRIYVGQKIFIPIVD
jgi:LysM repeat protein